MVKKRGMASVEPEKPFSYEEIGRKSGEVRLTGNFLFDAVRMVEISRELQAENRKMTDEVILKILEDLKAQHIRAGYEYNDEMMQAVLDYYNLPGGKSKKVGPSGLR